MTFALQQHEWLAVKGPLNLLRNMIVKFMIAAVNLFRKLSFTFASCSKKTTRSVAKLER